MSAEPDPAAPPFGVNHHPQVGDPPADFDAEVPNQPGVRLGYECDGIRIANVLIEDAVDGRPCRPAPRLRSICPPPRRFVEAKSLLEVGSDRLTNSYVAGRVHPSSLMSPGRGRNRLSVESKSFHLAALGAGEPEDAQIAHSIIRCLRDATEPRSAHHALVSIGYDLVRRRT